MKKIDLLEMIENIDPSLLTYQEWINVGMALKHEGYDVSEWDRWSMTDPRYKAGECITKWNGFLGTVTPVTGGTIVQLAKEQGWVPQYPKAQDQALEWDGFIQKDELVILDKNWIEERDIEEPKQWNPVREITTYLETLFESTEYVGYVTQSFEREGKAMPTKGVYARTAGELIQELYKCNGDIGKVIGDYNPQVGAWVRFNPLDGKGIRNDNVTDFRYALVESDTETLEKQNAIIRELELPVACLVHSGNKSIHAIVKIDAQDYNEYRKRVDYLYNVCQKNGLKIDSQNRNPSRLSRLPGIQRNGHKQFLIDTNIGKESWSEWHEWIEGVNDDLPDPEPLTDVWDDLPPLAPPLIDGVLRQGHKMLLAGPSKAGKSYSLIQLAIAIAEGSYWFGWPCAKGKVLYVNLELDRASALHRFKEVYKALGLEPRGIGNIDIWNLRGKSIPMDKLAPKLIRRAQKKNYIAVIIDPIYKVITGDENSADQMAHFTNQFDKVCTELGSAVIYCHHHSKGFQGNKKAMDRASGSGVFARDPDALLDIVELSVDDFIRTKKEEEINILYYKAAILAKKKDSNDLDTLNMSDMYARVKRVLSQDEFESLEERIQRELDRLEYMSAWRIDATLREFKPFKPKNVWFKYPIHIIDSGILEGADPDGDQPPWKKNFSKKTPKTPEESKKQRVDELEKAIQVNTFDEAPSVKDVAEYLDLSEKTVRRRAAEAELPIINGRFLTPKSQEMTEE